MRKKTISWQLLVLFLKPQKKIFQHFYFYKNTTKLRRGKCFKNVAKIPSVEQTKLKFWLDSMIRKLFCYVAKLMESQTVACTTKYDDCK